MKRVLLTVAITGMALLAATSAATAAQIEGTVKSVDVTGRIITLDDGTTLTLAPTSAVDRQALRQGAAVIASYDEKDGKKVVTALKVRPGAPATTAPSQQPSDQPSTPRPR